jgi:hypothetical protein
MTERLQRRILLVITTCIAAVSIAACAVAPSIDGGIVGTGNRVDCEARTEGTLPQDCKRETPR